nr:ribonuclease H-like domain-containing protein [Tanacetum cinerariifolium]
QPEEPPFTTHMLALYSSDKPMAFKAPKPSSIVKRGPQGTNPRAKSRHKSQSSSKQPSVSSKEATKESASGNDASAASTAEVDPGNSAPNQTKSISKGLETVLTLPITGKGASSVASQIEEETFSIIKLEDLAKLVSHVQPSFKYLDSPEDDLVIVVDDSDEDKDDEVHAFENVGTEDTLSQKYKLKLENNKAEAEATLLKAQPSFPNVEQLKELLVKSLKTKFLNILSARDFSSSLPTKLKDLPSKFDELTKEVKGLKKQVHELEIEIPGDLKEIPTKLEDFTKTVTSLTYQVTELKTLQWEILAEFLSLPVQVASVQAKLKTLDALQEEAEKESTDSDSNNETHVIGSMVKPSRTKKLQKFEFIIEDGRNIHITEEEISYQKKLEEDAKAEAAKQKREVRKAELVDLLGLEVLKKYYNDKLQSDRYCDKILNRRAISRITNCDVLTRKGPITLKVYKEDGTSEIIPNFKASDLHLGEWREVMKVYPNRTGKGWEIIYKQIGTRMDYIHTTKTKLGINLDILLSKQDPLDKLDDLANKKRKLADDIHDYFKANKRLKSSIHYKDQLPGTVLNEPVLGELNLYVPVPESFHEQTDEELTENDIKRMDADDQVIQTILLGLPEDVYDAVDSCETAKEIWERVRQMMKSSDIGEQEKKAKLFNEWETFTSTDGESIESYYHRCFRKPPPMLNKENYVPWSSRLLRYAKSRPNGKLIHNSIINGPYTDDELTDKELKQIEADDQAIHTIFLDLPEDIYAAVDSCETAQEILEREIFLDSEGNPTTATEKVFETYKNVKQEIRDQLNAEAEAVQIILTGIDNDIYSTVDACPNAWEMWKAI